MSSLPAFTDNRGDTVFPNADKLTTSRLALGCMHLGGSWDPEAAITKDEKASAAAAVETALELGWNLFDHADIYAHGKSETVFGQLVREMQISRESIFVQSKCGIVFGDQPNPGDPKRFDFRREHIVWSVEQSLQRLGMDYLDSLLLHRPDFLADPEEVMAAFTQLRDAGKVMHFGVSNFTPPLLSLYKQAGFIPVANQVELSLLKTALVDASMIEEERKPLPACTGDGTLEWNRANGVVTQAWAPLAYGYLSGRPADWEHERVGKAAAEVKRIAELHGVEPEAVVIGWLLRHPAGIQPVIGTRDPNRLKACHQALKLQLDHTEWYSLYLATRASELP